MRTVVGVLRGGPSSDYDLSLQTGAAVLTELDTNKYDPRDIFISKQGEWHLHGVTIDPERALAGVDVAFNALHGEFGEDGQVQRLLERMAIPYTGSDAFACVVAYNKEHTTELASKLGITSAHRVVLDSPHNLDQTAFTLFRTFPHPAVVKPVVGSSALGMTVVDKFHNLEVALQKAFSVAPKVLVEEYIKGKEAMVGVIDNFRNEKTYALLPAEVVPPATFCLYNCKEADKYTERIPGNFSAEEKQELTRLAKLVHEQLGLAHYSRSDFIVSKRGIYFLEVNTLPELRKESVLSKSLHAVGSKLSEFLDHVVQLALQERRP